MNGQQLLDALLDIQRRGHPLDRLRIVVEHTIYVDGTGCPCEISAYPQEAAEHVNSGEIILK